MLFKRFCCMDLKTGIYRYAIIVIVLSVIITVISLFYEDDITEEETYNGRVVSGSEAISIAATAALAQGAKKEKRMLLLPYLILQGIVMTIATVICGIFVFQVPELVFALFMCAFFWYVWLCVLSFYQSLAPKKPNYAPQSIKSDDAVYVDQPPSYEDCPKTE